MSCNVRTKSPSSSPRNLRTDKEVETVGSLIWRKLNTCPVNEKLKINRVASLESPRMATSEIISPCDVVRERLNKIGSRLPKQFYRKTGEVTEPIDLTAGEDRFVVFKNTNPSDRKTVGDESIKKRVNESGILIDTKLKEPLIKKDLTADEERFIVFKETNPRDRKTVDDKSNKIRDNKSKSLVEKKTTEPLIQKKSKDDRIKNLSNIDESSEMRCRTSLMKPKNAVRSKIDAEKQMTLGRRIPVILQEKQIVGTHSKLNEKPNLTYLRESDDRQLMKGENRVERITKLHHKTLEEPGEENGSKPIVTQKKRLSVVNTQIAVPILLKKKTILNTLTKPIVNVNNIGRSLLSDVAPIRSHVRTTERRPHEGETQILIDAEEKETSVRRRKLVTKLASTVVTQTKASLIESSNEAHMSKDLPIVDLVIIPIEKSSESQNEQVILKKSKVKDVKSNQSQSSTMSDPGSKWDIENKKRQNEFSDKVFREASRCLQQKMSEEYCTRHVSTGDLDSKTNSRIDAVENKQSTASSKKISHTKKRSVSDSKRSRPKPILRKSSSSEDRNSDEEESQTESKLALQKLSRVRFDLPGSENSSLIKKSKKTSNFLKNEINALKLMSSVIVEEDSDFPGDRSSKSSGEKLVTNVKSDLEHRNRIDSVVDKSPARVARDESEILYHNLDVRVDVWKNERDISSETSLRPELDDVQKHDNFENHDEKHDTSLIPVSEMRAYMLKERIEAEYHRKRIALNGTILKLKDEQHRVMESYSKVTEEYDGLQRQGYDVTPVEDLLVVALDKVKDYLIAGQLANIRSAGDTDNKLSEDVSYTVCVPSVEILQGDAFLKDFKRKLRHFSARSYDTATCISQKLNGIINKFKSGSLHKKNSEDSMKEGEASMVLCEQLKFELGNHTYEIMRDVKGLLKQNQLLSQLQQQVDRKLDEVIPQKNEERKLELEKLVEENRKLQKELRDSNNKVRALKETKKINDQSASPMKMRIQEQKLQKNDNRSTDNAINSIFEYNQERTFKNDVPDERKKTSLTSVKERFGVGAMELIERYQARCCSLEEDIASVYSEKKALEKKLRKKITELRAELTTTTQKLLVETDLRSDYEKDLEETERFISERESAMCRLIKLNDPSCRHPYPRLDMAPSEREKMTWIELQRARSMLKQTRNEVLKVTAERDECLSTVSRFLGTKTRPGDHGDPANRLVIVEDKLVEELRGQVSTLTAEVEKRKEQKEKQRKETKKMKSVLEGLKCGADVQSVMNDNYDLKKQVEEMRSCQKDLSARNEQLDALLCAKMFENAQRDRVMVEHCAAYEAHETLVALMNERHAGKDGITSSATRLASLLSAAGNNIFNMVSGRRGNPDR